MVTMTIIKSIVEVKIFTRLSEVSELPKYASRGVVSGSMITVASVNFQSGVFVRPNR